jgi:hypothetical protein
LHNLAIHGNDFVKQNEGVVVEMQCKFLEYVKSTQLQAAQSEDVLNADLEEIEIRMTPDGYPIIPKVVMDKES